MGILRYEIKKLFINKVAILIIIALTILPAITNYFNEVNYNKTIASVNDVYELEEQYEGKIDEVYFNKNADKLDLIKNKEQFQIANKDEQFYFDYYNAIKNLNTYEGKTKQPVDSISSLKEQLERMDENKEDGTYYYKNTKKKYEMMLSAGEPKFYFARGWNDFFSNTSKTASFFIGMIILLLVSSIFSNEYSSGMDSLILSSKNGRAKIVKYKLAASTIFSISLIIFYNIIQFISIMIPMTTRGWNTPIRSQLIFMYSPYNLTMLQYFGINIIFQIVGAVTLSFMVMLVSSLCKSSLATFFISFCIYLLPFIVILLGLNRISGVNSVMNLSITKMIGNYDVFKEYLSYNILGIPILHPYVIIVANTMVAIIFGILTKYVISKKDAC